MKKASKTVLAAAIAGLMVGTTTSCKSNDDMQDQNAMQKSGCNQKGGCNQKSGCSEKGTCQQKK